MKKSLLLFLSIILLVGCKKDDVNNITTPVPTSPENLLGSAVSSSKINLSWTDRSTNETGFKIERKLQNGIFLQVGTVASNITTFTDTGLNASTIYIYRVFSYNSGGNSPIYSNELTLSTLSKFPTITIGSQKWTTTNLDESTYSDGTPIPQITDTAVFASLTTGAWCYYKNSTANGEIYGKLYNWYAVKGIWNEASKTDIGQRKKLAPDGHHIASYDEWFTLAGAIGGFGSGGKMKATGTSLWKSPNTGATNESGFTGLPGGGLFTNDNQNTFATINESGYWWSSDDATIRPGGNPGYAWFFYLTHNTGDLGRLNIDKSLGLSVRCIKD
jgi:uncharacterized protein (TIGR02145 family)